MDSPKPELEKIGATPELELTDEQLDYIERGIISSIALRQEARKARSEALMHIDIVRSSGLPATAEEIGAGIDELGFSELISEALLACPSPRAYDPAEPGWRGYDPLG